MKIVLTSVGTRGDIEPMLAVGQILEEKGHQVICGFPEQFRKLTKESGLEFASLGSKYLELVESDAGKAAMGGSSGFKKFFAYIKLAINQTEANKEFITKQYEVIKSEKPDRIVYNAKSVYPIIWEVKNGGKTTQILPLPHMHYVKGHSFIAFKGNYGNILNKLSFSLVDFGIVTTTMIAKKWLKITEIISRKQIGNVIHSRKSIYTISPSLFPRPEYWHDNIKILGYYERKSISNWYPEKTLTDFIEKHNKILFITFGSMINPNPKEKSKIIIKILKRNNIPAIINVAAGGLVKPDNYDAELIHFVSQIPYDWIFPKMYAVIHHGGSGTTHMGLKYGCPTMIIPHLIDQFAWNKTIADLGVGPKGMKISKITTKKLEPKILELVNDSNFKNNATQIGNQMNKEDFKDELYRTIIE